MSNAFCITIDTEPDCDIKWKRSDPLTFESVCIGIPEYLRPVWNKYKIKPVYFVSPEVLHDSDSCKVLRREVEFGAEIGTHLHSEYIGPNQTYTEFNGTNSKEYPCFAHDTGIERAKIQMLTERIEDRIGVHPISYRAARYGADLDTIKSLMQLGYHVDSSVTPHIDWSSQAGVDHSMGPDQPYFIAMDNYYQAGESDFLEIPITIAGKRLPLLPDKWLFYRWLRPSHMTVWEMKSLVKMLQRKYPNNLVLNMMFHSMEIIPGKTPFVRNRWHRKLYMKRLTGIVSCLVSQGIESMTLSDIYCEKLRTL